MGKVLVIGASTNPKKVSYHAVRKLLLHRYDVVPIGIREGVIGTCPIIKGKPIIDTVDLIILYINSEKQEEYYDYIVGLKPKRLLFNPGTENPVLSRLAIQHDIEIIYDCALTLINAGVWHF